MTFDVLLLQNKVEAEYLVPQGQGLEDVLVQLKLCLGRHPIGVGQRVLDGGLQGVAVQGLDQETADLVSTCLDPERVDGVVVHRLDEAKLVLQENELVIDSFSMFLLKYWRS